ncbi:MAG: 23S rRNA (uracil(1939)-C(5))-methyltransferase RlmD [Candidatus Omnitrophica bacterium]|nr:23S rRNA (uracil(1939)-C(5))-methyltransferase RlmD [Candidatus Omnitrophota bacterium]
MKAKQLLIQEKAAYAKITPRCQYFGVCGGCALQDLAYEDQLTLKRERLQRAFARFDAAPPIELIGLEEPWRYRNKAEFTFGASEGRLVLGYHAANSFWRVVDLEDCLLLPEPAVRAAREVCALAVETGLPPYHPRTHQGWFRYLVVRSSRATGRVLLGLITTSGSRDVVQRIAETVRARHPAVASVYWGVTNRFADVAVPDELTLLSGEELLEDQIGPFRLRLHPLSFLQPTSHQAERMYELVTERLRAAVGGVAWDLYCGVGLVAFYLARRAQWVYGIDLEPTHLELARLNASRNGVGNVEFRTGRVESLLSDRRFWLQEARPDAVVVDPPRAGLHPDARSSLLGARPKQIAYLSCNVQSLVRDLQVLLTGFPRYRLSQLTAFDMFPQTNHVETVALLER